ncbi:MAG: tetratricopeptide repeat protein [Nitrospira sp.]|nr:tetratricopeptide repeat protein [Nitrospira sp.]
MDPEVTYLAADGLHYGTDEAQFDLYNFQPSHTIDELIEFAQTPCPRGHLVELRGPRGIGKQYLIHATAYRGSEQGKSTLCTVLQLPNKYDPATSSDSAKFIEQLKETHPYLHDPSYSERLTRIKETFHTHQNSIVNATAATLMATMSIPDLLGGAVLNSILSLWSESRSGAHLAFTPEEQFHRFLQRITGSHHLFLYVPDGGRNSLQVFNWALDCLVRLPNLTMVVGLEPETASPPYRGTSPHMIALAPYQEPDVATLLKQKVPHPTLSPTFVEAFTRHTSGFPGHMALLFAQCLQQDLFAREGSEHSLFAETDAASEDELGAIFIHGGLYAPINKLRKTIYDTVGDERGHVLDAFLCLAATCGDYIPFDWIVDCLQVSDEDSDWLEDLLTDELKECFSYRAVELKAFVNCEIYQPTNPWLSATITQALGKDLVQQAARKFSLYLSAQGRPMSEEVAKLFAAVFMAAGQEDELAKMNQLLDCWVGYWNASALKQRLIAQLAEQHLHPDTLWRIIQATDGSWPAWRRLVLLEAYGEFPGGMPDDHRVPWQSDVGICLLDSGRYEDARQVFQDLLNSYTATSNDEYLVKASFLSCLGSIEIYLDQAHLAFPCLQEAEAIQRTALPPLHPALAPTLNSLGDCLRELGRPQEALEKLEEAESIQRTALPPLHPRLALTLNTLGNCLRDLDRPQEAMTFPRFHRHLYKEECDEIGGKNDHENQTAVHGRV